MTFDHAIELLRNATEYTDQGQLLQALKAIALGAGEHETKIRSLEARTSQALPESLPRSTR